MTIYTDGYGGDTFTAKDARVNSAQGTYNYGAAQTLDPSSSDSKILLFFDLSAIPAGSVCNSATLYLYNAATKTSERYLTIYSILSGNSGWVEGTRSGAQALSGECCWNAKAADGSGGVTTSWAGSAGLSTSGTDYNATSIGSMTYPASAATGTEMTASLTTSVVDDWFGSNDNNFGIVAWTASGSAFPACYSSDYTTDTSKRPKLVIDYTAASGGVSVEPSASTATGSTVNPTVILGSLSVTPTATVSTASTVNPTAILGSISITPTAGGTSTYTDGPGGDVTSSDDAQMSSVWATYNGGAHANFQIATNQKSLIRFNLSAIPDGAICTGATLYLYHSYTAEGGGTVTVYVHSIAAANSAWQAGNNDISLADAGECCWNALAADGAGGVTTAWAGSAGLSTAGTDYETTPMGTFDFNGGSDIGTEFTCDLDKDRVKGWFGASNTNYGIVIFGLSNSGHLAQSDNATSGYRPKLIVTYSEGIVLATTVDPTVEITGGISINPATSDATATTVSPTVTLGSTNATPDAVTASATTVSPTVILGAVSIEPTTVTVTTATIDPTVILGAISITPAQLSATATTVDPTVEISGGSQDVTPAAIIAWATTAIGSVIGGLPARTGRKKGLLTPW